MARHPPHPHRPAPILTTVNAPRLTPHFACPPPRIPPFEPEQTRIDPFAQQVHPSAFAIGHPVIGSLNRHPLFSGPYLQIRNSFVPYRECHAANPCQAMAVSGQSVIQYAGMVTSLEHLAEAFDAPIASQRHRRLESTAWMGGPLVEVRYYLGRLVRRNIFRASDVEVFAAMVSFVAGLTSEHGASLLGAYGLQGWMVARVLLRYEYEMRVHGKSTRKKRPVAMVRAFLTNPSLTVSELAKAARTTEKQVKRNTDLKVLLHRLALLRQHQTPGRGT